MLHRSVVDELLCHPSLRRPVEANVGQDKASDGHVESQLAFPAQFEPPATSGTRVCRQVVNHERYRSHGCHPRKNVDGVIFQQLPVCRSGEDTLRFDPFPHLEQTMEMNS